MIGPLFIFSTVIGPVVCCAESNVCGSNVCAAAVKGRREKSAHAIADDPPVKENLVICDLDLITAASGRSRAPPRKLSE
jgi:hypothetical protein